MVEGHILKFLNKEQSPIKTAKMFLPQETYGHCRQSPEWFKRKFSLQPKGGYQYKFDEPKFRQKFNYLSQRSQFRVNNQQTQKFNEQIVGKNVIHNLKKGLLSEYLDKNSWMKETIPLNGFERSQQSRKINNLQRQKNIETMRLKKSTYIASKTASNFYSSKYSKLKSNDRSRQIKTSHDQRADQHMGQSINPQLLGKTYSKFSENDIRNNHQRSKSISLLIGQKQKIRSDRNQMAFNKIHKIQKVPFQNACPLKKFRTIDSNFIQERMALTARQWGKGRQISPNKSIEKFDSMIQNSSVISSKNNSLNRGLLGKKLSAPVEVDDFPYNFEIKNTMSNQL